MLGLLLCFALGQKAVISDASGNPAPVEAPLGEPLFFSSAKSEQGEKCVPLWEVDPPERAERMRVVDGGKTLIIGTGLKPVVITVRLIVAKGDNASIARVSVKAGGVVPPDPVPTPPGPGPGPSPSKFGIDNACKIALLGVSDQARKTALKAAYQKLSLRAFGSLNEAAQANVAAVKDALGPDLSKWSSFNSQMNTAFGNLMSRITAADMPTVFAEMAAGLE